MNKEVTIKIAMWERWENVCRRIEEFLQILSVSADCLKLVFVPKGKWVCKGFCIILMQLDTESHMYIYII
jgi:hypothetical protein